MCEVSVYTAAPVKVLPPNPMDDMASAAHGCPIGNVLLNNNTPNRKAVATPTVTVIGMLRDTAASYSNDSSPKRTAHVTV